MNNRLNEYINSKHPIEEQLLQLTGNKKNLVIFDVGACEGEDSIRYSKMFPGSEIYAFEPHPENFSILQENIKNFHCHSVKEFNVAVSDKTGTETLNISSGEPENIQDKTWNYGNKSSSLLKPHHVKDAHKWLKFEKQIKVETITLSDFLQQNKIERIDLLHMDVQGAEMKVLKGAKNFLSKINSIWLEVGEIEYYEKQPLKRDIEGFLKKNNFHLVTTKLQGKAGDQLYIRLTEHDQVSLHAKTIPGKYREMITRIAESWKKRGRVSYSQSGEDMIIQHLCTMLQINKPGYIDVGAHDPYHLNNSAWFYENGSRGINIEPDPVQIGLFKKHRPKDVNLNIAIGQQNKKCTLHIFRSRTLNTMDQTEAERMIKEENEEKIASHEVQMLELYRCILLFAHGIFPDILFVDTEGLDRVILNQLDPKKGLPKIICAETINYSKTKKVNKNEELIRLIESKGFRLYADTFINSIFYRSDLL